MNYPSKPTTPSVAPNEKPRAIDMNLRECVQALEDLEERAQALSVRLQPILSSKGESAVEKAPCPPETCVIANQIRNITTRIQATSYLLATLVDCSEV